jgi:hypothetical protein
MKKVMNEAHVMNYYKQGQNHDYLSQNTTIPLPLIIVIS